MVDWIIEEMKLDPSRYRGHPKETIMTYFTTKFPKLMLGVYTVMKECKDDTIRKYYDHNLKNWPCSED